MVEAPSLLQALEAVVGTRGALHCLAFLIF
jgi:hypothetical protein